jgi:beta-glucosidase
VLHRSLVAHGRSVQRIRAHAGGHKVGWAPVGVTGFPDTDSPEDIEATRKFMFERCAPGDAWSFSNALYADPVILGSYPDRSYGPVIDELPDFDPTSDLAVISQPIDFYGVNIYQGTRVKAGPDGEPVALPYPPGHPRTMMDWPVTPEALYWGPRLLAERYGLPVYITENGCATTDWVALDGAVHDPARIDYIQRHLTSSPARSTTAWTSAATSTGRSWTTSSGPTATRSASGSCTSISTTGVRTPKDSYRWFQQRVRR